jgi:hypothetical protein
VLPPGQDALAETTATADTGVGKVDLMAGGGDASEQLDATSLADTWLPDSAGPPDSAPQDSELPDSAPQDSVLQDSAPGDSGAADAGPTDSSPPQDSNPQDSAPGDAVTGDGTVDAGPAKDVAPEIALPPEPLPYPAKTAYQVKGIQPDFWPNKDEIAGNKAGSVAMNLVWFGWEPSVKASPCPASEQEFDGHCFAIDVAVDAAIRDYTALGVVVTAVVYGVPGWARQNVACSPVAPGFEIFCKPDNPADYARFAGMLAQRYDGLHGNGRIADFVIHNEVNSNDWFDVGCGQGTPCDTGAWLQAYADNYALAYDAITQQQPHAKVLMSFTHHFDTVFDQPGDGSPLLSVKTFVTAMAGKLGDREWRVAYHPYPPNLLNPQFSPLDLPKVTYGNIGVIVGWLMAAFPDHPHAWDVELTESGVNSLSPHSSQQEQAEGVCRSLYNVLATPGISNYVYHRMKDHPAETASGLGLGLSDENGSFKPAWATWALSNRIDLDPPQLSCGFENIPYTRLVRAFKKGSGHWATTRKLPDGFAEEQVYRLSRDPLPGSTMLFECMAGSDSFVSKAASCEGQQPMGPLGYIRTEPFDGGVALYRCYSAQAGDHMISPDPACESWVTESLLGYAQPW